MDWSCSLFLPPGGASPSTVCVPVQLQVSPLPSNSRCPRCFHVTMLISLCLHHCPHHPHDPCSHWDPHTSPSTYPLGIGILSTGSFQEFSTKVKVLPNWLRVVSTPMQTLLYPDNVSGHWDPMGRLQRAMLLNAKKLGLKECYGRPGPPPWFHSLVGSSSKLCECKDYLAHRSLYRSSMIINTYEMITNHWGIHENFKGKLHLRL